jgi:hypothetical protein
MRVRTLNMRALMAAVGLVQVTHKREIGPV